MINTISLEEWFISQLATIFGYENAVRIEDALMILCTLLLGYMLGQLKIAYLFKPNYLFTNKLKNLVFIRNKHGDIVQYDFKFPKTFFEKVEIIIGLHMANRNKSKKLSVAKAKWYSRLAFALLILLTIWLILIFTFMFNVVEVEDLKHIKSM